MIKFTNDNYCFICWKILRCYKFSYPLCLTPVIRSLVQEWRRLTITDWPVLTFINPFHDVYSGICLYDRVIALKGSRYIWHSNIFFSQKHFVEDNFEILPLFRQTFKIVKKYVIKVLPDQWRLNGRVCTLIIKTYTIRDHFPSTKLQTMSTADYLTVHAARASLSKPEETSRVV